MSETFSPPKNPSVGGAAVTNRPRVVETALGDGYSQRAADGINANRRTVRLDWAALARTDAQTIDDFFLARAGVEHFDYALPPSGTPSRKWICTEWTRDPGEFTDRVTATLVEVFDP